MTKQKPGTPQDAYRKKIVHTYCRRPWQKQKGEKKSRLSNYIFAVLASAEKDVDFGSAIQGWGVS